ncbi:prohead protease/major capsid protein fusion protein [Rhizobium leguminosarum]|uniref:prohead protease/major capsid protein fusion protein n=1 Tax=Rhizobium leguminosarum TaxID=384 RepID=UPI0010320DA5|nr:prohead protease/major capsid protein fusion protein [Rhizobium leguminosarum]TBG03769.1 peptidase [Rhizobium leguminosarum]
MQRKIMDLPPFGRDIEIRASSFEEASNSVEVIWTTGAIVRRFDWRDENYYDEELVVDQSSVRLDRLNNGAPLLDTHDDWSLKSVIGTVVPGSAELRGGKGIARVRLSVAEGHRDIVANIKAGIIKNISVGYRIHKIQKIENAGETPVWRVIDWEPLELSAVPVPADTGAQIRSDKSNRADEQRLAPCEFVEDLIGVAALEATRAERTRATTIRSLAATAGLAEFGEEHAGKDTSVDHFRSIVLDRLAARSEQTQTRSNIGVDFGRGNAEQRASAIHNALMHRYNPVGIELTADGRNYRGMTLLDIGRDVLEANGISTRGMSRQEIAAQALAHRSGGLHTTSDFPGILSNVAHTTLRAAYAAAPQTFRPLVRETTVPDFKPVTRAQLGEAPALNKVNEHGEFKRGTLGEGKESYKIATYGKIVGITRQAIVNDDLDAFSRIPAAFGLQAAQLESDLVWAQILANPTMGDGIALFHANHKNLLTTGAISIDTMSAGRTAFAMQTGLDGKTVLGLTPTYLIVPVALQTVAEQFIGQIVATKTSDVVPESLKRVQIIAEGRMDAGINRPDDDIVVAGSAAAWYLAGSIVQGDIVELAYLDGNRGVYTEQRVGFDIDGVEIKVRLDVGAKVMDWRNIAKNPGA